MLLSSSACCHLTHFYSSINPAFTVLSWQSWCDFLPVPLQDHSAARWQDLFCWHRDSHWVEWVHGGGCPGWRKSSQRGTDAQGTLSNVLWKIKDLVAGGEMRTECWQLWVFWISMQTPAKGIDFKKDEGFALRFGMLGRALSSLFSRIKFFLLLQKSQTVSQTFFSQIC